MSAVHIETAVGSGKRKRKWEKGKGKGIWVSSTVRQEGRKLPQLNSKSTRGHKNSQLPSSLIKYYNHFARSQQRHVAWILSTKEGEGGKGVYLVGREEERNCQRAASVSWPLQSN